MLSSQAEHQKDMLPLFKSKSDESYSTKSSTPGQVSGNSNETPTQNSNILNAKLGLKSAKLFRETSQQYGMLPNIFEEIESKRCESEESELPKFSVIECIMHQNLDQTIDYLTDINQEVSELRGALELLEMQHTTLISARGINKFKHCVDSQYLEPIPGNTNLREDQNHEKGPFTRITHKASLLAQIRHFRVNFRLSIAYSSNLRKKRIKIIVGTYRGIGADKFKSEVFSMLGIEEQPTHQVLIEKEKDLVPLLGIDQLSVSKTNFVRVVKGKCRGVALGKSIYHKKKSRPTIALTREQNREERERLV